MAPVEPLVTAAQVGEQLKIPASTVARMHRAGLLQGYYVGERGTGVRFRISEIIDTIKSRPASFTKKATAKKAGKPTKPVKKSATAKD
jgi:hypothetical protein